MGDCDLRRDTLMRQWHCITHGVRFTRDEEIRLCPCGELEAERDQLRAELDDAIESAATAAQEYEAQLAQCLAIARRVESEQLGQTGVTMVRREIEALLGGGDR